MSKKLLALVKWVGGEDDKTYTAGIPLDWILGFDYEAYTAGDHDPTESYVVEWRDTKKQPKGGWHCYDCLVVLVSDRIAQLNNHLKILEGAKSPKVVQIESSATNEQALDTKKKGILQKDRSPHLSGRGRKRAVHEDKSPRLSGRIGKKRPIQKNKSPRLSGRAGKKRTIQKDKSPLLSPRGSGDDEDEDSVIVKQKAPRRYLNFDSDEDDDAIRNKAGHSKTGVIPKTKNNRKDSSNDDPQNGDDHSNDDGSEINTAEDHSDDDSSDMNTVVLPAAKTKTGNKPSGSLTTNQLNGQTEKEPTLSDIMAVLKKNEDTIRKLENEISTLKEGKSSDPPVRRPIYERKPGQSYKNARDLNDGEFVEGNVEIGPPGSGIYVTDMQWTSAISKGTYKAMATTLITSLFSTEVLLKSNFKGGESKLKKKIDACPKYTALDGKIVQAVMYSVRGMYPQTFTEVGVGQAINVKLTNMRAKHAPSQGDDEDND